MKNNLAKVLGLEEYNQEPNIRVEPTEDEVIEIQQDKFEQEMSDHREATTEALEAIGNAQALASVIARNNSQDKTAYELLKVAVEQLKEKTGVKTQSVSLESLDKGSYKTEALQDIKNFIAKVIKAIKDAFFAMWEKVKAFFKGLFDRNKSIEKEADQIAKDAAELEKEINKAPKTEDQAKNYSSDYFGVKKNYFEETKGAGGALALGHTPGTTNKTTISSFKTSDKDVDYSDNKYDRLPGAKGDGEASQRNFFSSEVISLLGVPKKADSKYIESSLTDFRREVREVYVEIINQINKFDPDDIRVTGSLEVKVPQVKDGSLLTGKFAVGKYGYELKIKDSKLDIDIKLASDKQSYELPYTAPWTIRENHVAFIHTLTRISGANESIINKLMERKKAFIEHAEKMIVKYPEDYEDRQGEIKKMRDAFKESMAFVQSCMVAQAKLSAFVQKTCKAILLYMRQSINNIRRRMGHLIQKDGYIRDIQELEYNGWTNG